MLNPDKPPRRYKPVLSVGHLCSVSILHWTVSEVARWHSNDGIHVLWCNTSHRTAWVLRTEAGSCSQQCFPSRRAPGTESGGEHRARCCRHRWSCMRGLIVPRLQFAHQLHSSPSPEQGQPAKTVQLTKWHEQMQILKRAPHPQCTKEGWKWRQGAQIIWSKHLVK